MKGAEDMIEALMFIAVCCFVGGIASVLNSIKKEYFNESKHNN